MKNRTATTRVSIVQSRTQGVGDWSKRKYSKSTKVGKQRRQALRIAHHCPTGPS